MSTQFKGNQLKERKNLNEAETTPTHTAIPLNFGSALLELYNQPSCRQKDGDSFLFDKRFREHLIHCAALILLKETKTRFIHFQDLSLNGQFASILFWTLHKNKQINKLQFTRCNLSFEFCTIMAQYLQQNAISLQELSITDCSLDGKKRHTWISYGLSFHQSLKKFELHNPSITGNFQINVHPLIEHYMRGLLLCLSLESLDLSHSHYLNPKICGAIVKMLNTHKQLKFLNLNNNLLANEAIEIIKTLQTNTTLEHLFMNNCQCMNTELDKEIRILLEKNKTLKTFEYFHSSQQTAPHTSGEQTAVLGNSSAHSSSHSIRNSDQASLISSAESKGSQEQQAPQKTATMPALSAESESDQNTEIENWEVVEVNEEDPDPSKEGFENSALLFKLALTKEQLQEQGKALSQDLKQKRDKALAIAATVANDSAKQVTAVSEQVVYMAQLTTSAASEVSLQFLEWASNSANSILEKVQLNMPSIPTMPSMPALPSMQSFQYLPSFESLGLSLASKEQTQGQGSDDHYYSVDFPKYTLGPNSGLQVRKAPSPTEEDEAVDDAEPTITGNSLV